MCARLRAESAEIQALMEWQYCLRVEELKVVLMAVMIVCQANFHLQQYPLSKEKQGKKQRTKSLRAVNSLKDVSLQQRNPHLIICLCD